MLGAVRSASSIAKSASRRQPKVRYTCWRKARSASHSVLFISEACACEPSSVYSTPPTPRCDKKCKFRNCLKTPLEASEAAKHEADHRDRDERLAGGAEALVLLADPALLAFPIARSFDHPAPRKHPESWRRQILGPGDLVGWDVVGDPDFLVPRRMGDDLRAPAACLLDPVLAFPLAVGGGIQPDMPPARTRGTPARAQHELHAVAIPAVRWRHDGAHDHSFRVDQQGARAPRHLLDPLAATQSPHAGGLHRS